MFKEFICVIFSFFLVSVMLKMVFKKKSQKAYETVVTILLVASVIISTVYNLLFVFPSYRYENVYLGDSEKNLFAYKDNSEFPWTILFPVLKNRSIYMDVQAKDYEKLFETFARSCESTGEAKEFEKLIGNKTKDFKNIGTIYIEVLDYIFYEWEYENKPNLYINLDSIRGTKELAACVDDSKNLYLMSLDYYENLE